MRPRRGSARGRPASTAQRGAGDRCSGASDAPAQRPLHILAFLLPLIVWYEVGSMLYLTDDAGRLAESIRAWSILLGFFEAFDLAGLFLPAAALVAVLLAWHVMVGDPWRIRPAVLCGMAAEALLWTPPLVLMGAMISAASPALAPAGEGATGAAALYELSWQARLTLSVGAGVYEELLFRFVLMAAIHAVLVDLARWRDVAGTWAAIAVSSAAFALYHRPFLPDGSLDVSQAAFLALAGVYFGVLYVWRGLGVAAGTHALYDAAVLILLAPSK